MKFTKRRKAYLRSRIQALRQKGLSYQEIAEALGISESSAYRLRKDTTQACNAVFFREGSAQSTQATRDMAVWCVKKGLSLEVTGWLFSVSERTVRTWVSQRKKIGAGVQNLGGAVSGKLP